MWADVILLPPHRQALLVGRYIMELLSLRLKYLEHAQTLKDVIAWLENQKANVLYPISNEVLVDLGVRSDKIFNAIQHRFWPDYPYSTF